jgi:hypothetical protein
LVTRWKKPVVVVVEEVGSLASSDGLLLAAVLDGGEMQMELCCLPVLEELLPEELGPPIVTAGHCHRILGLASTCTYDQVGPFSSCNLNTRKDVITLRQTLI